MASNLQEGARGTAGRCKRQGRQEESRESRAAPGVAQDGARGALARRLLAARHRRRPATARRAP